jgi:hypothetical protein
MRSVASSGRFIGADQRFELSESTMDDSDGSIETPASPLDMLIERWWEDHFPGSAVARDTGAWNVAHAAKETLKRLLMRARSLPLAKAGATAGNEDLQGSN